MLRSLQGLSVGDAFGECFSGGEATVRLRLEQRQLAPGPWFWTDDTAMALSIARLLRDYGTITQDTLAHAFAAEFHRDPDRGYGGMARRILRAVIQGAPWRNASSSAFGGQGSHGNGGAMRAAPLGAYFADCYDETAHQARLSAEVTHAHPEGQAGAIAIAAAAAWAAQAGDQASSEEMLATVIELTPPGETLAGLIRVQQLGFGFEADHMAALVGSGQNVSAQDTVPFTVWCAARWFRDYEEALWQTASGRGDVDTTCAIVGGIVALSSRTPIPAEWFQTREKLPADFSSV